MFGSPRSAIRAAVALQQRFVEETIADPSLPLTVGIGLDAGEAVPVDGGYRGGALNVAARLCSRARAGEVLASREIVHLARRIDGLSFTERGQAELKGLDQPVHVVAGAFRGPGHRRGDRPVRPDDRLPPASTPTAERRRGSGRVRPARRPGRRPAGSQVRRRLGDRPELDRRPRSGVGRRHRDARTRGSDPGSVAASAGTVWVTNPDAGTVTRIDTEHSRRSGTPSR